MQFLGLLLPKMLNTQGELAEERRLGEVGSEKQVGDGEADYVTGDNNSDGIADALERLVPELVA